MVLFYDTIIINIDFNIADADSRVPTHKKKSDILSLSYFFSFF